MAGGCCSDGWETNRRPDPVLEGKVCWNFANHYFSVGSTKGKEISLQMQSYVRPKVKPDRPCRLLPCGQGRSASSGGVIKAAASRWRAAGSARTAIFRDRVLNVG